MNAASSPTALEQRLRESGYLGTDSRALASILKADAEAVSRAGCTHAAVASRLKALRDAGLAGLGEPVRVPPHYNVCAESERGRLACPFGDARDIRKTNVTVANRATGACLVFTDLNIHLIEAHGFYEGRGAPFRIEPETALTALEITAAATDRARPE